MDDRFRCLSFASGLTPLNAFGTQSNVGSGNEICTDTTLRLESPGTSGFYDSYFRGRKRKWGNVSGTEGLKRPSLGLGLGHSSSSSDSSKKSSATICTMSSAKEVDDGSSVELGLNFQLNLGKDSMCPKNHSFAAPNLDLQLSLSVGTSESVITSATAASAQFPKNYETSVIFGNGPLIDDGSTSSRWKPGSHLLPYLRASETSSTLVSLSQKFAATPDSVQYRDVSSTKTPLPKSPVACTSGKGPTMDDRSTSSCWKSGSHLLPYLRASETSSTLVPPSQKVDEAADSVQYPDVSSTSAPIPKGPVACTSRTVIERQKRNSNTKNCGFPGCVKGARGASGLCISHGGGQRCQKVGCQKGAEGKTIYCKAHGGGRRCEYLGCTRSAEGRTDYCIAHGGGRRCSHEGCVRAARGKSGLCIRHGGGKRCQEENCTKSAEGFSGLCISHGGGRRCQYPECTKGAQGSTVFCKAHGGGKRCSFPDCKKGAEGSTSFCKGHGGGKRCSFQGGCAKSVHGGTQFCVAHGGGKRCAAPDCTKSARGRTKFCVRHGGGKRCRYEGCDKSAQGRTDFCKAHGGGKRCSWGQLESGVGVDGPPCDRVARGKIGLCVAHVALVQDHRVHGGATLGPIATAQRQTSGKSEKMKGVAIEDKYLDGKENLHVTMYPSQPILASLPESRVHGGSWFANLANSSAGVGSHSGSQVEGGTSQQGIPYNPIAHHWV